MEKELGAVNRLVAADVSGGLNNLKETVFNVLAKFFTWLSTHQGLGIIIILIVLGLIIWLILRAKKISKILEDKVSGKNKEIDKKDTLIREQENKIEALQKKMSDQQGFISEALLRTIKTVTGYDSDQLKIFFKFLTEISGNPLQIADTQVNSTPDGQRLEEKSDDSMEETDAKEKNAPDAGPGDVAEAQKSGQE